MKSHHSFVLITVAVLFCLLTLPNRSQSEDWHKITSADGKASVMFPIALDPGKVETLVDKTPAGKATTKVLEYQDDHLLFTISATELPGLAVRLAGEKTILKNAKEGILAKAFSKETEYYQYDGIKKPKVMLLKYQSANLNSADHPGYDGFAVLFVIGKKLYVVNSMLEKGTEEATAKENEAAQMKLLKSIQIHD